MSEILKPCKIIIAAKKWKSTWGLYSFINLGFYNQNDDQVYVFPKKHNYFRKKGYTYTLDKEIQVDQSEFILVGKKTILEKSGSIISID